MLFFCRKKPSYHSGHMQAQTILCQCFVSHFEAPQDNWPSVSLPVPGTSALGDWVGTLGTPRRSTQLHPQSTALILSYLTDNIE